MSAEEPTNQYERRKADTRRRLCEAVERLRAGTPQNPDVRGRKWKLDVKTVAQEAGVSRNAIYQDHREILDGVRAARTARGAKAGADGSNSEVRRLKRELRQAKHELRQAEHQTRVLVTQKAELHTQARLAQKQLKEPRAHYRRLHGAS